MAKYFLVGVANVLALNASESYIFSSKTMLDNSIEITTGSTPITGGQGNVNLFVYYHTSAFNITLTETQFNLDMIAANVGQTIGTGTDVWVEEDVTLNAGAGTLVGTAKVTPDGSSTVYGYVTDNDGTVTRVTIDGGGKTFTHGTSNDTVCVKYYAADSAARYVEIGSNIVPSVVRLILTAQLGSQDSDVSSSSIVGSVQIEVPRAQLSGSSTISLTSDGYANMPLTATALAFGGTGCSGTGNYAKITVMLNNDNWYDHVIGLAFTDSDIDIAVAGTQTIEVWAIPDTGSPFIIPNTGTNLTFTSSVPAKATVGANSGVVTGVQAGNTVIEVKITAKTSVKGYVNVDVT